MPRRKRSIPHLSRTFFHRQGLKLYPSENFLNKFIEEYNSIVKDQCKIGVEEGAYFIYCIFEAIIHCLDFGINIDFKHRVDFTHKMSDYAINKPNAKKKVAENIKKIHFKLHSPMRLKMQDSANKDNVEYQEYLKQKKEHYTAIRKYYTEFYDKKGEWWTYDV